MITNARLTLATLTPPGLRFDCEVDQVRFSLDSGPEVTSPSPIQILLCSAGACTGMDVISILRKKRQKVSAYEIALEGVRRDEHPRGFTSIAMVHRFHGADLNPAAIDEAIRLSHDKYCSVLSSLKPGVTITSRFEILPADAA